MSDFLSFPDLSDIKKKVFGQGSGSIYDLDPDYTEATGSESGSLPWNFNGADWYKIYGYQFVVKTGQDAAAPKSTNTSWSGALTTITSAITNAAGKATPSEIIFSLPIPPQTLNTKMVMASQATPTIGGVVEETSGVKFWQISMSGTMGTAITRSGDASFNNISSDKTDRTLFAQQFRDKIATTGLLSGPLAGLNSAISKIGGVLDNVSSAISSGSLSGVAGGVTGALNSALLPPLPYSGSAVNQTNNGFTEMQELQRFFYTYSRLKAEFPERYSLHFRNLKTGQEWQCILADFQIMQNAQNPLGHKYSISLKAWNVIDASTSQPRKDQDRFGPNGDLAPVNLVNFNVIKGLAQKATVTNAQKAWGKMFDPQ